MGTVRVDKVRDYAVMRRGCTVVVVLIKVVKLCGGGVVAVTRLRLTRKGEERLINRAMNSVHNPELCAAMPAHERTPMATHVRPIQIQKGQCK